MLLFQFVNETSLEVCLKDIQRYDATHDPITVNYMAIGCEYAQKITWHSVTKVSYQIVQDMNTTYETWNTPVAY